MDLCCLNDGQLLPAAILIQQPQYRDQLAFTINTHKVAGPLDTALKERIEESRRFAERYTSDDSAHISPKQPKSAFKQARAGAMAWGAIVNTSRKRAAQGLDKALMQMPEWMQILTHDQGAYVFVAHMSEPGISGKSLTTTFIEDDFRRPFMIQINALHFDPQLPEHISPERMRHVRKALSKTVFEELIHELHKQSDRRRFAMEGGDFSDAWFSACISDAPYTKGLATMVREKDPDAAEAASMIAKTEPTGGSLHFPKINEIAQAAELLVDIFDTEIALRKEATRSGSGSEAIEHNLRQAFSFEYTELDENRAPLQHVKVNAFELSRQYVYEWIDRAAAIIEKQSDRATAERYKRKWLENPFCHAIEITRDPRLKSFYDLKALGQPEKGTPP